MILSAKTYTFMYVVILRCSPGFNYDDLVEKKVLVYVSGLSEADGILKVSSYWMFERVGKRKVRVTKRISPKDVMIV